MKSTGTIGSFGEYTVAQFAEKPELETVQQYLASGDYSWNGGMFVLNAGVWLKSSKKLRPDIAQASEIVWAYKKADATSVRPRKESFSAISSESIDYAVMEKCPGPDIAINMMPFNVGWNNLGSWDAVWRVGETDDHGNVTNGDTLLSDTTNTHIHTSTRLVTAVGSDNLVIVETADAVLLADKNQCQHVIKIVTQLEQQKREEKDLIVK